MKTKYKVFNYHSFIVLPTEIKGKTIFIEGGNLPKLKAEYKILTIDEISYINDKTKYFKNGRLEFDIEDRAELFKYLDIQEDEHTFYASDILDIVKNPTKEKLERVIKIEDISVIDLFKGLITSYKNTEIVDISQRVVKTINKRWQEVYSNPYKKSSIKVFKTENEIEKETIEKEIAKALLQREAELEKEYSAKLKSELAKVKKANKVPAKKAGNDKTE